MVIKSEISKIYDNLNIVVNQNVNKSKRASLATFALSILDSLGLLQHRNGHNQISTSLKCKKARTS